MRRVFLPDPPPADAEVHGRLKFQRIDDGPQPVIKAWQGRQSRPYVHHIFRTALEREQWIQKHKDSDDAILRARAERKAEEVARLATMRETIQVGTLLHYSWGWEQTQCDYFQVIKRSGSFVTIRPIKAATVPGSEGNMSEMQTPCPDQFFGEPMRKRITPYGVKMDHGTASPVAADAEHYCSWYG